VPFPAADVLGVPILRRSKLLTVGACLAVSATGLEATLAHADSYSQSHGSPPSVVTRPATNVGPRSAVLQGTVDPNGRSTTYSFQYGTTTAYGKLTAFTSAGGGKSAAPVSYALTGLTPSTTYHVRLGAGNSDGMAYGADIAFTTPAESVAGGATPPSGSAPAPSGTPGSTPALAAEAVPALGRSVNVSTATGTVLVRVPGASSGVPLADVASVPVGAILDTRKGTVDLETALPGGGTQKGAFHGGVFQVRQAVTGRGMTELVLRGPKPTCGGARAAATSKRRPARNLWGSDNHGRFRTRGSNAVATVRGTQWFMADRCDGTYTHVKSGSVKVRELRGGRTVVLHAGQSHLARAPR
jgi:hypothetical protein